MKGNLVGAVVDVGVELAFVEVTFVVVVDGFVVVVGFREWKAAKLG